MDRVILDDPQKVAAAFAGDLVQWISDDTVRHIALSGGSTPNLLFALLTREHKNDIPWERLHIWWGDERCVPPTDNESNFRMAKELLLDHVPVPPSQIHRIRGEENPVDEARRYGSDIRQLIPYKNGWPHFDLIILGMGEDGHTASIFPHQMELLEEKAICGVADHPVSGQKRITLTGSVINHASRIAFLVTGRNKSELVGAIFHRSPESATYPAYHIHPVSGYICWYLDRSAAERI